MKMPFTLTLTLTLALSPVFVPQGGTSRRQASRERGNVVKPLKLKA